MLFFDAVQLTELIKLCHKRVNHLHPFKQLRTALLIASVFLTLSRIVFTLQVRYLVLKRCDIALFRPQLHDLLPELVQQRILVSFIHNYRLCRRGLKSIKSNMK